MGGAIGIGGGPMLFRPDEEVGRICRCGLLSGRDGRRVSTGGSSTGGGTGGAVGGGGD